MSVPLYAAIGESKLDAGVVVDRLIAGRGGSEAAADDTEEETPPPSMRSRSAVTQVSLASSQTTYWCGYRSVPGARRRDHRLL